MRFLFLLFLLILNLYNAECQNIKNGEEIKYFPNSKSVRYKVTYKDSAKNGLEELYSEPGKIQFRRNYKNGKLHGYSQEYFSSRDNFYPDMLKEEGNYIHGKKDGTWKFYYRNYSGDSINRLAYIINYKNDLEHGKYISYYEDGSVKSKSSYKNGKRHGLWQEWYEINGKLSSSRHYKAGKLQGKSKTWLATGNISFEGNYKNDLLHGIVRTYYENSPMKYEITFKNGKRNGKDLLLSQYGLVLRETYYNNNFPMRSVEYNNGCEYYKSKAKFVNGYAVEKWLWEKSLPKKLIYHGIAINDSVFTDTLWKDNVLHIRTPDTGNRIVKYVALNPKEDTIRTGQFKSSVPFGIWIDYSAKPENRIMDFDNRIKLPHDRLLMIEDKKNLYSKITPASESFMFGSFYGSPYSDDDRNLECLRQPEYLSADRNYYYYFPNEGIPAEYPGGDTAVIQYFKNQILKEYPDRDSLRKVITYIKIVIDKYGNPIIGSIAESNYLNGTTISPKRRKIIEEAILKMQKWQPAVLNGKFVLEIKTYQLMY